MSTTQFVGQTLPLSIAFLDQNGKAMKVGPDQTPSWATSAAGSPLTQTIDGLTASFAAMEPGDDVVSLTVVSGGKTFQASIVAGTAS